MNQQNKTKRSKSTGYVETSGDNIGRSIIPDSSHSWNNSDKNLHFLRQIKQQTHIFPAVLFSTLFLLFCYCQFYDRYAKFENNYWMHANE